MRSIPFILLLLVLALETEAQKKNVVKTDLFSLLWGQHQLAYERVVLPNLSFQILVGIIERQFNEEYASMFTSGKSCMSELVKQNGFILIPEVRYYFKGQAPEKIFIGGFARFRQKNKHYENTSKDASNVTQGIGRDLSYVYRRVYRRNVSGMGVHLGYQWISKIGLSLEIFAGPAFKYITFENIYDNEALNKASNKALTYPLYEKEDDESCQKYGEGPEKDRYGPRFNAGFHISYAF